MRSLAIVITIAQSFFLSFFPPSFAFDPSYAKILGEKLFRTWEIPRSGSKAKDGAKDGAKKEEDERKKD